MSKEGTQKTRRGRPHKKLNGKARARWREMFGEEPNYARIAREAGLRQNTVCLVLGADKPWRNPQEAIAEYAGVPLGKLFGDSAWFRVEGRRLAERMAEVRAAAERESARRSA